MIKNEIKLYKPSNSVEGEWFISEWCENCARDASLSQGIPIEECEDNQLCPIVGETMCFDIEDENYPKEWQYCKNTNKPVCTAFVDVGNEIPVLNRDDKTIDMFEVLDD